MEYNIYSSRWFILKPFSDHLFNSKSLGEIKFHLHDFVSALFQSCWLNETSQYYPESELTSLFFLLNEVYCNKYHFYLLSVLSRTLDIHRILGEHANDYTTHWVKNGK